MNFVFAFTENYASSADNYCANGVVVSFDAGVAELNGTSHVSWVGDIKTGFGEAVVRIFWH